MTRSPHIVGAWRTPLTKPRAGAPGAADLATHVIRACAASASDLGTPSPQFVVMGNARGPGGNVARVATLAALGHGVPAMTVDLQCGSGQAAIHAAADMIVGGADVVIAGGVESVSEAAPGRSAFAPSGMTDPDMGPAADDVAREWGISREEQDAYAWHSWQRTWAAAEAGHLDREKVSEQAGEPDYRVRRLKRRVLDTAKPSFGGTVTPANACADADGAAAVVMVSDAVRDRLHLPSLSLTHWVTTAANPAFPGACAGPAIARVLDDVGLGYAALDRVDVTEAFAAQVIATARELNLGPVNAWVDRFNPSGGAIALGHPWGASGAILVARLWHDLQGPDTRTARGVVSCAVGGGLGTAMMWENRANGDH